MAKVDDLSIEISADISKATKAIDSLNSKLGTLSTSLGRINSSGLTGLANGVNKLTQAMQGMNSIKTSDFTKLTKNIEKIGSMNTQGIYSVAGSLNTLSVGLSNMGNMSNTGNITAITNSLKNLARIDMSGFDTGKFSQIQTSLTSFFNSLSSVGDISIRVTQLVSSIARLSGSGQYIANVSAELPKLGNQVVTIAKNMQSVGTIDTNITKLIDGLSRLANAGKKVSDSTSNLDRFGDEVIKLLNKLKSAPNISTNLANTLQGLGNIASSSSKGFGSLTSSIGKYSGAASNAIGKSSGLSTALKKVFTTMKESKSSTSNLLSSFSKLYIGIKSLTGVFTLLKKSIDISSDLTEVQNVVDTAFGSYSKAIEDFSKVSIADYGMSELTAKTIAGRYQAMGMAVGFAQGKMANMSVELTKLAADMASFYNVEQESVATSLQAVFTGETEPLTLAA